MADTEQVVKNLTLVRTQEETIVASFDTPGLTNPHKYQLFQLNNQVPAFRSIANFDGKLAKSQRIELTPNDLLDNRGSFYVLDVTSTKSSYSTGLLDLSSKQVNNEFDMRKRGIQPGVCQVLPSGFKIYWTVSNSVKTSCSKGYTVVIDGPSSNVVTVPCAQMEYEIGVTEIGVYKIRVESRENNELGAYFIIQVRTKETRDCINKLVVNATSKWIDNKLKLAWQESSVVANSNILIDSYQIIAKDDTGNVVAKTLKRIEVKNENTDTFQYVFNVIKGIMDKK